MNLQELLNNNFIICQNIINKIENSNVITRYWDRRDSLSDKIRSVQLLGTQLSNEILNAKNSIQRNMGSIQYSEKLDKTFWQQLTNANQFQNFVLSKVNYPNIPQTKKVIEAIFQQINNLQNSLLPKITAYNRLIQEIRKHRSRPFSFGSLFGLPTIKYMPNVINMSNVSIF